MKLVADVYAGDNESAADAAAGPLPIAFLYTIVADAAPDVLVRVSMALSLSSQCPSQVVLSQPEPDIVRIDATLLGISPQSADYVHRKLLQITDVREVDCAPLGSTGAR